MSVLALSGLVLWRMGGNSAEAARAQSASRVQLVPPADVIPVPESEPDSKEPAEELNEEGWAKFVLAALPAQTAKDKIIRVGLSTKGAPLQFYSTGRLGLTDPTQPGRRVVIPPGQKVKVSFGNPQNIKSGATVYSGSITVEAGEASWAAWGGVGIYVANGPARMTSNGANPRWGRPYRGHFEVWPQRSAEAGHREGDLTVVNAVPLEEYLKGVVPWEMSPAAPLEALKAQAICARTKTLQLAESKKFAAGGFDVCDYDACQGYPGTENEKPRTTLAVEQTSGSIITYKGRLIDAVYGTNSGGITASASDVWKSTSSTPYLQSVRDLPPDSTWGDKTKPKMTEGDWAKYCSDSWPSYAQPSSGARTELASRRATSPSTARLYREEDWPEFYRWKREIPIEEAQQAFADRGFAKILGIEVLKRTDSGRIRQLRVFGEGPAVKTPGPPVELILDGDGAVRSMFSKKLGSTTALPSSSFTVTPQTDVTGLVTGWTLQGAGWGHGVGMCQRGAQNHALQGWDAAKILKWYYRGVEISTVS